MPYEYARTPPTKKNMATIYFFDREELRLPRVSSLVVYVSMAWWYASALAAAFLPNAELDNACSQHQRRKPVPREGGKGRAQTRGNRKLARNVEQRVTYNFPPKA